MSFSTDGKLSHRQPIMKEKLNFESVFEFVDNFVLDNCLCGNRSIARNIRLVLLVSYWFYAGLSVADIVVGETVSGASINTDKIVECVFYCTSIVCGFCCLIMNRRQLILRTFLIPRAFNTYRYVDADQQRLFAESQQFGLASLKRTYCRITLFVHVLVAILCIVPALAAVAIIVGSEQNAAVIDYEEFFVIRPWSRLNVGGSSYYSLIRYVLVYSVQFMTFVATGNSIMSVHCLYYYLNVACTRELESLVRVIAYTDRLLLLSPILRSVGIKDRTTVIRASAIEMDKDQMSRIRESAIEEVEKRITIRRSTNEEEKENYHRQLLLACFFHHRAIHRYTEQLLRVYKPVVFVTVAALFPFLIALTYMLIAIKIPTAKSTVWLGGGFICVVFLFIVCYTGENYTTMNDRFRTALYSTEWYCRSRREQKLVFLLLTVTNFKIRMSATSDMYFSYGLYVKMIRSAYTYLNFLLKLK